MNLVNGSGSKPQINLDPSKCLNDKCESCKGMYFVPKYIYKVVKGIMVGSMNDQYIEIRIMVCEGCGKPHKSCEKLLQEPDLN